MDGMYFLLLLVPIIVSILTGDYLRKKITSLLLMEYCCNPISSNTLGILAEILTVIAGIIIGFLLIRII